jgi:predicted dehydrogenase
MSAAAAPAPPRHRVAIAGAGIGVHYARSFQSLPGVDVVALCASSPRRARPAADELGIDAVYLDFAELLAREQLDIAVIATPNDLHHPMVLAALESGCHVVCDKPLALDTAEAAEMLAAARRRHLRHVVPFWLRFVPAMVQARALLADGALGEIRLVDVRFLNCGWGDPDGPMRWQFEAGRAGSGALSNLGSHAIDALHWLAGDIARVAATTAISVGERRWPDGRAARPDVEDTVAFVGDLVCGAPLTFLASSVAYAGRSTFSIAVHASGGSVSVQIDTDARTGTLAVQRRGEAAPSSSMPRSAREGDLAYVAYDAIAGELVAAIHGERDAVPSFADGLRAQIVIDAALASVAAGGWQAIDYDPDLERGG